jgi:hypothetical protein
MVVESRELCLATGDWVIAVKDPLLLATFLCPADYFISE